ncbi:MAG: hypothetical protein AB7Q42_21610 [Acidimicrobiia bacterium]
MPIDTRRWFDRTQPQTLQIATWLLYINAFFELIDLLDTNGWIGIARIRHGSLGTLVGIAIIAAYVGGAFLMANERKIGYVLAIVAAFSPFVVRLWLLNGTGLSLFDKLTGNNTIGFIFEVALCALLLHPQSRSHQRIWFK